METTKASDVINLSVVITVISGVRRQAKVSTAGQNAVVGLQLTLKVLFNFFFSCT
jgi:hypothetical protein